MRRGGSDGGAGDAELGRQEGGKERKRCPRLQFAVPPSRGGGTLRPRLARAAPRRSRAGHGSGARGRGEDAGHGDGKGWEGGPAPQQ